MTQTNVQTLEKRLKRHPQLAEVARRIRESPYARQYFYHQRPLSAPLSDDARTFLQDYHNLVKGIKILPRAEQHYVGDGIKAVRQKVRDLQRSEKFNPLHQDLKLVDIVAKSYLGIDWFSERQMFSDELCFSSSLQISKGENGKLRYDPTPILEMFFYGRVMEELGFEKTWEFLRAKIHDFGSRRYYFDDDKKYAIIREREALKYIQDIANKVNNKELPEPTERGLVYFNTAVQKILSDGYKQFDADTVPETMSSLAYAANSKRRGPISERSRIRTLKPELEEMMKHGHSFCKKLGFQPRVTLDYEEQSYRPEETKLVEGSQPIQPQKPWYQRLSDALRRK